MGIVGILALIANFPIESLFFFLIKRRSLEFVFIWLTLFDLAKEIKSYATIIGCFGFYILISARPRKLRKVGTAILFTPILN